MMMTSRFWVWRVCVCGLSLDKHPPQRVFHTTENNAFAGRNFGGRASPDARSASDAIICSGSSGGLVTRSACGSILVYSELVG